MNTIVHAPSTPSLSSLVRVLKDFASGMHAGLTRVDPSEAMLLVAKTSHQTEGPVFSGTNAAIARVDAQRDRLRMDAML